MTAGNRGNFKLHRFRALIYKHVTSANLAVKLKAVLKRVIRLVSRDTGDVLAIRGAPITTTDFSHAKVHTTAI